ncbi:MAG: DUF4349 domain-containing protein [Patescibacteria group bacterium]
MAENTQHFPEKKYAAFAFVGGMVVIGVLWFGSSLVLPAISYRNYSESSGGFYSAMGNVAYDTVKMAAPVSEVVGNMTQDRKVTNNYVSVHVKSVKDFHNTITMFVDSVEGKVMNEYVTVSSDDQAESGTMTVLVPNKNSQQFFEAAAKAAIKIVDRQVNSYEISQEYTDLGRKLAQYEATYEKVLKYYDKAVSVEELLKVQNQLDQLQQQIDSVKGRKMALEELSNNTQYTLYSSTNEYNLPYVPQGTFEVAKTFKLAVRSLVLTADKVVAGAIYVLVYVPFILVLGGIALLVKKYLVKR